MVGLRGPLVARMKRGADESVGVETLVGESASLLGALAPGGVAKAELRGTTWTVRSEHGGELAVGRRCRVERVDGLTLWVRPE
jgi:membrane protein implicated in regulation of membrane protease activity